MIRYLNSFLERKRRRAVMKFRVERRTPAHPGKSCRDGGSLYQRVIKEQPP